MNKVLVLQGDGIGPSIISSAVDIVGMMCSEVEFIEGEIGFSAYEKTGQYLPKETLDLADGCETILCGPVRTPRDEKDPLEMFKLQLDLYAIFRNFTTLAPDLGHEGMDITLWASNTTLGHDVVETPDLDGITLTKYVRSSSYNKMMARALTDAEIGDRKRIACITRDDLFPESSAMFKESFDSLFTAEGYGIEHSTVQRWASMIVRDPCRNDFVICADLYSHVASGILAGMTGGNHLSPMGFVGDSNMLFVPGGMHMYSEVPKDYANPTSAIVSGATILHNMNRRKEARSIIVALKECYAEGDRTPDVGGSLTTKEFTKRVMDRI